MSGVLYCLLVQKCLGERGLGLGKRSKKRFAAQQMVMLLGALAHNVIVWAGQPVASPTLQPMGRCA